MRIFGAAILASTLIVSSAFAAAPLAPGKPAGVKQAQAQGNGLLILTGVVIVAAGAALLATGNSATSTNVTSSTNP